MPPEQLLCAINCVCHFQPARDPDEPATVSNGLGNQSYHELASRFLRQSHILAGGRWYAGHRASQEVMMTRDNDRPAETTGRSRDEGQDSGRERISRAAYELFSREGVRAV